MSVFKKTAKQIICLIMAVTLLAVVSGCKKGGSNTIGASNPPVIIDNPTADPNAVTPTPVPTPTPEPTPTPRPVYTDDLFTFTGEAFCIANLSTGTILFEKNSKSQKLIASITKLVTALVALDYFKEDDMIEAKKGYFDFLTKDTTIDHYGLKEGSVWSVSDLLKLLMLKSYADAALMLQNATTEAAGRDFLELMNEKAVDIGMKSSHFDNSIGLDVGNGFKENYSTAEDVMYLLIAAYNNRTLADIGSLYSCRIADGTTLVNTNLLLSTQYSSSLYTAYVGKTGSTNAAGLNVASTFISDKGVVYGVVYLHGVTGGAMYDEVRKMVEYAINNGL